MNWYLTASTYTTQCFIFGALIGAHMAEAMFVKHLGFMKDRFECFSETESTGQGRSTLATFLTFKLIFSLSTRIVEK